ncbi:DUF6507 family protein [Streptomyces otsuchiensis]|uniref:DUF6507 family protein n=1 Tax=Streptomyces otsuchiensis TaxID=2681388 RepID=UPI0010324159|nr:DUF6507 family protein [Streptomyces otsuchiensis]
MFWDVRPDQVGGVLSRFNDAAETLDADARSCVTDLTDAAASCGGLSGGTAAGGSPVGAALARFTGQTLECLTSMRGQAASCHAGAGEATASYAVGDGDMESAARGGEYRAPIGYGAPPPQIAWPRD